MTPEEKKARQAASFKRWWEKRRADPVFVENYRAKHRARYAADPEQWKANAAKQRENQDPAERAKYLRDWYDKKRNDDPVYYRNNALRRKYGLTPDELLAMLAAQEFKCAICRDPIDEFTRRVDHDHATGTVRGLLCHHCNVALGHLKDSADVARKAASYLEAHIAQVMLKDVK